jgi:hypothetical protein
MLIFLFYESFSLYSITFSNIIMLFTIKYFKFENSVSQLFTTTSAIFLKKKSQITITSVAFFGGGWTILEHLSSYSVHVLIFLKLKKALKL